MTCERSGHFARAAIAGAIGVCLCAASHAAAQPQAAEPSPNATVNLIRLLVKQGVISQKSADALVKEAEEEAAQARAAKSAAANIPGVQPTPAPPAPGTLRVPYVPEIVKNQIRDEVKQEVMAKMETENWAQPQAVPSWSKRVSLHGDIRFRNEADLYSKNNDDQIIDYATFNSSGPTDINPNTNPDGIPFLNTRADRYNRLSIRARLGVDAIITDGVLAGIRLASGGDNGPVSTTQLLGGGFGKKDIWLDQAFVTLSPTNQVDVTVGRMVNPFLHTDLVYDDDLNLDGVETSYHSKAHTADNGPGLFVNAGFFPLEYIGSNFPNYCGQIACPKSTEHTKWLLAAQTGIDWRQGNTTWRFAVGAYDFHNIQGELSDPCFLYLGEKQCSTDPTRPAFMQKGNTLFAIRQIALDPSNPDFTPEPEFVGLSFKYRLVNATEEFSYRLGEHDYLTFDWDYVRNVAYDPHDACRYAPLGLPLTNVAPGFGGNIDPCDPPGKGTTRATIQSGPNGYYARLVYGDPHPLRQWAWNVGFGYKYLEPDAVPDAFTDSDFHLGGTNAKGFIFSASLGVFQNTWLQARYFSASEVFGPPLAIDVVQFDLNAGF